MNSYYFNKNYQCFSGSVPAPGGGVMVKTMVVPHGRHMVNLVPAGASHPLYGNSPESTSMRSAFLNDSFIDRDVAADDPAMATEGGLEITNFNNNKLLFQNTDGKFLYLAGFC